MYYITLKTICGNFFWTVATFFKKICTPKILKFSECKFIFFCRGEQRLPLPTSIRIVACLSNNIRPAFTYLCKLFAPCDKVSHCYRSACYHPGNRVNYHKHKIASVSRINRVHLHKPEHAGAKHSYDRRCHRVTHSPKTAARYFVNARKKLQQAN